MSFAVAASILACTIISCMSGQLTVHLFPDLQLPFELSISLFLTKASQKETASENMVKTMFLP